MKPSEAIAALRATKGTNAKLAFLAENSDNEELREVVYATYEPTISYFVSPETMAKAGAKAGRIPGDGEDPSVVIPALLKQLSGRELTGHAARDAYIAAAARLDAGGFDLLATIVGGDLKAGIAVTGLNKVWPGLITDVPYMRCCTLAASKLPEWEWGSADFVAYSQIKADGMYANVNFTSGMMQVSSRAGSIFMDGPWFDAIRQDCLAVARKLRGVPTPSVQFHGEMLVYMNGALLPRAKGNGVLNSILKTGENPGAEYRVAYVVWDQIPMEAAKAGGRFETPYAQRFGELEEAIKLTGAMAVKLIETRVVKTYADAATHFIEAVKRGEEGTIVKRWDLVWEDGDSMDQVKMKISFMVDLVIKGFNPGKGKNAALFGSLQCESSCGQLKVGVSGMSDETRKQLSANREYYTDKVAVVEGNDILLTDGVYSIFLPRLEEVRIDKYDADDLAACLAQLESAKNGEAIMKAASK